MLLLSDIDKGGVLPTSTALQLLSSSEQQRIKGFIIKFRGDVSLLEPGNHKSYPENNLRCISLVDKQRLSTILHATTQMDWQKLNKFLGLPISQLLRLYIIQQNHLLFVFYKELSGKL